jgi:hypothetical protein
MALGRKALPSGALPTAPANKRWVTFTKPVVQGAEHVLEYLGRYVHKTALGNHAVVADDDRTVTFRYTENRTHQRRQMTLPADEFLRRFLQHVPPKGFHRVRCFGLLGSTHRATLKGIQLLLMKRVAARTVPTRPAESRHLRCPHCGEQALALGRRLTAAECGAMAPGLEDPMAALSLAKARAPPPKAHRGNRRAA